MKTILKPIYLVTKSLHNKTVYEVRLNIIVTSYFLELFIITCLCNFQSTKNCIRTFCTCKEIKSLRRAKSPTVFEQMLVRLLVCTCTRYCVYMNVIHAYRSEGQQLVIFTSFSISQERNCLTRETMSSIPG